jgi:hypothetical protein
MIDGSTESKVKKIICIIILDEFFSQNQKLTFKISHKNHILPLNKLYFNIFIIFTLI